MKVALVHDWLVSQRGGENVLLELARRLPDAPIFTLVHTRNSVHPELEAHPIHTSFIQHLPGSPASFRRYLPLFPAAIERFDFSDFDLVISTSHCVAKGIKTRKSTRHVSYIHTPMRYLWDQLPQYVPEVPLRDAVIPLARLATTPLRAWDVRSSQRPELLIANSRFVQQRIERVWNRPSRVVYPPVDTAFFNQVPAVERHGFVVVSALVPYKRVELAVIAATQSRLPLTVIGDGPERERLRDMAGPTVHFLGGRSRNDLRDAYAKSEALLFCGEEDFGIVPVEAMAAGCPVIALARGGALETVVGEGQGATGVLFGDPSVESLLRAIDELRHRTFDRAALQAHASRFSPQQFINDFEEVLASLELRLPPVSQPGHFFLDKKTSNSGMR